MIPSLATRGNRAGVSTHYTTAAGCGTTLAPLRAPYGFVAGGHWECEHRAVAFTSRIACVVVSLATTARERESPGPLCAATDRH
jgi:hypothetical protein